MALKSTYAAEEKGAEIEELLDALDKLVDRVKVLYEQYFMGIQKQAPAHLHTEAERRIRDLQQMQVRNTALRYRLATLQQKFGAYNTYWKRTLREIEQGRYVRNLARVRQKAQQSGEEIPEEILARMPKRMRDAIERDRAIAVAQAEREGRSKAPGVNPERADPMEPADIDEFDRHPDTQPDAAGFGTAGRHRIEDTFGDDEDLAAALSQITDEALAAVEKRAAKPASTPPPLAKQAPPEPDQGRTVIGPPPAPRRASPPELAKKAPPDADRGQTVIGPPPSPRQSPPARPPSVTGTGRSATPIPGMTEADTRALYAKYVKAREVVGDKTDAMSYDRMVRVLSSQAPRILEQHKASGVDFNVVIKDNKVVLKAKPK